MRPLPDRRSDGPRRMRKGGVGLCAKGETSRGGAASVYQTRRQGNPSGSLTGKSLPVKLPGEHPCNEGTRKGWRRSPHRMGKRRSGGGGGAEPVVGWRIKRREYATIAAFMYTAMRSIVTFRMPMNSGIATPAAEGATAHGLGPPPKAASTGFPSRQLGKRCMQ